MALLRGRSRYRSSDSVTKLVETQALSLLAAIRAFYPTFAEPRRNSVQRLTGSRPLACYFGRVGKGRIAQAVRERVRQTRK